MPPEGDRTEIEELPSLAAVLGVVEAACELVLDLLRNPIDGWEKTDDSPVTSIDIAVDRFLHAHLRALMPEAGWLSEETADDAGRLAFQHLWVVDPIDGTRSLLAGRPEFCVSAALVRTGEGPLLGVIANPMTGERFTARLGHGSHDGEGRRLQVAGQRAADDLRVLVSRSDVAKGLWQGLLDDALVRPIGSLAYKMALVATGSYDGHATPTARSEWDAAAGALILAEAGGLATDLRGEPLRFNQPDPTYQGMVVASAASHGRMLELARLSAQLRR